jgi:hypothetical protein
MATKLEKYLWLVDTLRRSPGLSLEELDRAWSRSSLNDGDGALTKRTFHRLRREVEDRFGLRIRCDRHDFTYRIEEDADGENGVQNWLLDTLSVDTLLRESRDLRDRILFENIPSGQQHLASILAAMRNGTVLEMSYARFSDEQPYTTWLHPYFVKVFSQRWYVIGPTGRHPRTPHVYALDRVLSLRETSGRFEYPSGFDPQAFFADSYGIFHGTEPAVTVVIRAGERQAKFMRSLPLHASQQEISETEAAGIVGEGFAGTGSDSGSDSGRAAADGMAYFALRLVPTLDLIQYLLSQGAELEVLAPASLRDDLSRRASAIARLYR